MEYIIFIRVHTIRINDSYSTSDWVNEAFIFWQDSSLRALRDGMAVPIEVMNHPHAKEVSSDPQFQL